jgi:ATP-dependent DNA ligase
MSLLQKSTKFRKRNLRACVAPIPGRIELVTEFEGRTAKDVRMRMQEIMNNRGEGLILKHPDSEYVLNGRNRDWIKVRRYPLTVHDWLDSDSLGETRIHGRFLLLSLSECYKTGTSGQYG